jgi:hypothetical protein
MAPLYKRDLECIISGLGYDMEDLDAKIQTSKGRLAKKILTIRKKVFEMERNALLELYTNGSFFNEEKAVYRLYDTEMSRANDAVDACSDF